MDEIVRMMTRDGAVKAMAITGRDLTERARQIHKTLPVATAALGRTLMACSMMGDMLKGEDDSLTLRINGGGPLGTITAVSDSSGNVRGYVQNGQVDLPRKGPAKLDVGAAVGRDGYLTVIRDLGLKEPYVGSVALVSGEIAEDLTSYFVESEQIPTACALGVLVDRDQSVLCAGGYILQLLPGADGAVIDRLEEAVGKLGPVTEVLRGGADARALLERLLDGMEPELLERSPVTYRCYCSRERVERAIVSMGAKEIQDMIDAQGEAEVTCQFCDQVYRFSREELEALRESCG
ncbi:MAG TPA: Hsp33 family molecular chaperone HslO [Candidatus Intestinimonas stercoravium]|uniref:Hsp33 family molecular chaperone HslO n=1 Tax=uncultured Intestinimonas sp. TaxID=1689265 RepID=UPI001FA32F8E|nr:Hsp33 family molecular chaperone HslO [uncultured Intestinimonas sp.]HJA63809.1 Hsp33 family molecular chaperone HslO [Candidatus Intestinimonas stercoravium]